MASETDFIDLTEFIIPEENFAVPFSSRLINSDRVADAAMLQRNSVILENTGNEITGAIMLTPEGIICPVLTKKSRIAPLQRMIASSPYFRKRYLTLMGSLESVESIERLFTGRKKVSIDYNLLSAKSAQVKKVSRQYLSEKKQALADIMVQRASLTDIDRLMPLRKAYEIEEVLLNPYSFNEQACRSRFAATIKEQAVFFAEKNGVPVATSCINAGGINWLQLGGVFTLPEYRAQGISALLMTGIADYAASISRELTLFVKKDNTAANRLYANCGFIKLGYFRISYLERR